MAQKTNPQIFQLTKTSNWQSKSFEKKTTEYSKYSTKDLELRSFIIQFFESNNRIIHRCKICYFEKSLHIFISYYLNVKSSSLMYDSIPYMNKLLKGKKVAEPVEVLQLVSFKCKAVKSCIKQILQKIKFQKRSATLTLLKPVKVLHQMLKFLKSSRARNPQYFKKSLNILKLVIHSYQKKIHSILTLNHKHLKISLQTLNQITCGFVENKLKQEHY
jgi:hypothetical protein